MDSSIECVSVCGNMKYGRMFMVIILISDQVVKRRIRMTLIVRIFIDQIHRLSREHRAVGTSLF